MRLFGLAALACGSALAGCGSPVSVPDGQTTPVAGTGTAPWSFQFVTDDGRPAADVEVRLNNDPGGTTIARSDERGMVTCDAFDGLDDFLIVDLPGHTLQLISYPGFGGPIVLGRHASLRGRVMRGGQPVAGARVAMTTAGTGTYMLLSVNRGTENIQVPDLLATTDADGRFSMRAVAFNGQGLHAGNELGVGAALVATAMIDGTTWFGQANTTDAGNRNGLEIAMEPTATVTGRVVHAETGMPLAGATVYGPIDWRTGDGSPRKTGADGRFRFDAALGRNRRTLHVRHELLPYSGITVAYDGPVEGGQDGVHELTIPVQPAATIAGRVRDAVSAEKPLIPVSLRFSQQWKIQPGWQGRSVVDAYPTADGAFEERILALPATVEVTNRFTNRSTAYHVPGQLRIEPGRPMEITLDRRPGVVFEMNGTPADLELLKSWGELVIQCGPADGHSSGYAEKGTPWFYPLQEWGQSMRVRIERRTTGGPTELLPWTTFRAEHDGWPVVLTIPARAGVPNPTPAKDRAGTSRSPVHGASSQVPEGGL